MQTTLAIFSPTGTAATVARTVSHGLSGETREIDLSAPVTAENFGSDTVLVAAAPVYGGRIPAVAVERLRALRGEGTPAVALVVYGNRDYEDALLEWKTALEEQGFRVVAAAAFVAEHSIVRTVAAGRPDAQDLRTAEEFGAQVAQRLADGVTGPVAVPGNVPYKEWKPSFRPHTKDGCIGCGLCAAKCPVSAIPTDDPATTGENCISCMRCVAICPEGVRVVPAPVALAVKGLLAMKASTPRQPELFW